MQEILGDHVEVLVDTAASPDIDLEEMLKPTEITLEVRPLAVFVDDSIHFQGVLPSGDEILGEREIDIQVNGTRHITVRTDSQGCHEGVLSVPYRYVPKLGLRAFYYPRRGGVGRYLASLSPLVKLKVLFHEAVLGFFHGLSSPIVFLIAVLSLFLLSRVLGCSLREADST